MSCSCRWQHKVTLPQDADCSVARASRVEMGMQVNWLNWSNKKHTVWTWYSWMGCYCDLSWCRRLCLQVPNRSDSMEDEEMEQVMLYWNDGKKQKSIQDLVFDRQPEDQEILTYYRLRICPAWKPLVWFIYAEFAAHIVHIWSLVVWWCIYCIFV